MQISFTTPKSFAQLGPTGKEVEAIDLLVRGHVKHANKLIDEVAVEQPWRRPCHQHLKDQVRWWFVYREPRLIAGLVSTDKELRAKSIAFAKPRDPVLVPSPAKNTVDLHPKAALRRRTHQGREYTELQSGDSDD